jgi:hypothetical protein
MIIEVIRSSETRFTYGLHGSISQKMASVKLFVGRFEGVKTEVPGLRTKCPVSIRRIMLQQLQHPNYATDFDQIEYNSSTLRFFAPCWLI